MDYTGFRVYRSVWFEEALRAYGISGQASDFLRPEST